MLKRVLKVSVSFLLVLVLAGLFSHGVFVVRGADEASSSVGEADVAVLQRLTHSLQDFPFKNGALKFALQLKIFARKILVFFEKSLTLLRNFIAFIVQA